MAKLTKAEVLHVAKLARLDLTDKEKTKYEKQLSKVVEFISELDEVDTSELEPTSQTTGLKNVFRLDEINSSDVLPQDEALSGTNNTHNGYFTVGAILKEKPSK